MTDECPECAEGDLDLATSGDGRWGVEWQAVQCNTGDTPVQYSFQGSNNYYLKLQVANTRCESFNMHLELQDTCLYQPQQHDVHHVGWHTDSSSEIVQNLLHQSNKSRQSNFAALHDHPKAQALPLCAILVKAGQHNQAVACVHGGCRVPAASVQVLVNGQWVTLTRTSDNYFELTSGGPFTYPLQTRVTSVLGDSFDDTIASIGDTFSGTKQFAASANPVVGSGSINTTRLA